MFPKCKKFHVNGRNLPVACGKRPMNDAQIFHSEILKQQL